jgi:hypothetical protein
VTAVSFGHSDEAEMVNIYEKQLQMTAEELKMEKSFQKNYLKCIAKTPELLVSDALGSIKEFGTAVNELKIKQQEMQEKQLHHAHLQTWESIHKLEEKQQKMEKHQKRKDEEIEATQSVNTDEMAKGKQAMLVRMFKNPLFFSPWSYEDHICPFCRMRMHRCLESIKKFGSFR